MPEVYLTSWRDFLLRSQNGDGGWGYFPGKASWLEPTAYAMLALYGDPQAEAAVHRAARLLQAWQLPDGNWRAGAQVQEGTWGAALAVTLCSLYPQPRSTLAKGVEYLLGTEGAENCLTFRVMQFLGIGNNEVDTSHPGWPWRKGTSSWIEPTAHTLIALKKVAKLLPDGRIAARVRDGERAVLVRRCSDGGWNYGSPNALHIQLPSYPESTALALLSLQGRRRDVEGALGIARASWKHTTSRLAKSWLAIALQVWGNTLPALESGAPGPDCMLAALEMIAHPAGNHRLLRTGEPV